MSAPGTFDASLVNALTVPSVSVCPTVWRSTFGLGSSSMIAFLSHWDVFWSASVFCKTSRALSFSTPRFAVAARPPAADVSLGRRLPASVCVLASFLSCPPPQTFHYPAVLVSTWMRILFCDPTGVFVLPEVIRWHEGPQNEQLGASRP